MALRKHKDEWDGNERRRRPVVLIVNDDRDACEMLVRFLAAAGFEALGATSDLEAMTLVYNRLPRAVVLDMASGGIGSNLRLLDQIRSNEDKRIRSARAVLCATSAKNRPFSFQSGADSFLIRPFHIDELIHQVRDVLERPHDERSRHRRDELERHGDL